MAVLSALAPGATIPESYSHYVGRFAPTPSGPLHFGSIIAALGSFLDARANRGRWHLRIDDLDTPRVRDGAVDEILAALDRLGLYWDGGITYQSRRQQAYRDAEQTLKKRGLLYACVCSRQAVRGKAYPGTCRGRPEDPQSRQALRILTRAGTFTLHDRVQARYSQDLHRDTGDFIVRRADGLYAYHLAVVVDDASLGVTHIVRGADLLQSCPRQMYLQQSLDIPTPCYAHLPVAIANDGKKLSKRSLAMDVLRGAKPVAILVACLDFLGQQPGRDLLTAGTDEVIHWGIENWALAKVPRQREIRATAEFQSL